MQNMSSTSFELNQTDTCIIIIEPFYGGSHKKLIDLILGECKRANVKHEFYSMPSKKWHWRARTSALYFSQIIPVIKRNGVLFASSVLNLTELIALRPDLACLHKILYFHENQLIYPIRHQKERDFQYGYNQILSCLVADEIIFNSYFNRNSFLSHIQSFMKLMPDYRPSGLADKIQPRCKVLYFPLNFTKSQYDGKISKEEKTLPPVNLLQCSNNEDTKRLNKTSPIGDVLHGDEDKNEKINPNDATTTIELVNTDLILNKVIHEKPLHILWPHRWEHDKRPDLFFNTLFALKNENSKFVLSVLGETFAEVPAIFHEAKDNLSAHIKTWGYLSDEDEYIKVLLDADVVVSTADHEFFGVAMLEATHHGCYPICPNKLVYPEIFPRECLYNTSEQLLKILKKFCLKPIYARQNSLNINLDKFYWENLKDDYRKLLKINDKFSVAS